MTNTLIKLKHFLKQIAVSKGERDMYDGYYERKMAELIEFSEFSLIPHTSSNDFRSTLLIKTHPDQYAVSVDSIDSFKGDIKDRSNQSMLVNVKDVVIQPDMDRLSVVSYDVVSIYTEWEEINLGLQNVIKRMDSSDNSLDYQAIGNSARTILQKLADIVFDPNKHKPDDVNLPLSKGDFKNRLKTYIESELESKKRKKLRKLAMSSVNLVLDSIDFMNETTHKLKAEKSLAELCVISLISSVNVIKIIKDLEN